MNTVIRGHWMLIRNIFIFKCKNSFDDFGVFLQNKISIQPGLKGAQNYNQVKQLSLKP